MDALKDIAVQYAQNVDVSTSERVSGFPMPELYNQHYINKYAFPKGLVCGRKPDEIKRRN